MAVAWCGHESLADDLTQQALEKALKNLSRLKQADALEAWAFSILSNCFRDHCRKNPLSEVPQEPVETEDQDQPGVDELVAKDQVRESIRRAIGQLSPEQREVIMLVDLEGFSYTDVASILNIPMGTVMSRLNRARQKLKQLLLRQERVVPLRHPQLERVK